MYLSNGLEHVVGFVSANTTELYGQLWYGPGLIKYSHAVSNLFGFADSRKSGYLDLAGPDLGNGYLLNLHLGHRRVAHNDAASFSDWKVGVSRDFGVFTGAVALIGSDAGELAYARPPMASSWVSRPWSSLSAKRSSRFYGSFTRAIEVFIKFLDHSGYAWLYQNDNCMRMRWT